MYFDFITWSIWLIGFVILVIWIWVPVREFRRLVERRRINEEGGAGNGEPS